MVRRIFFAACAVCAWFFVSCANADPEIVSVTGSMVFDYIAEEQLPDGRLALFVQTSSEVQRVDSIVAVHKETGYTWRVPSPRLFKNGDKQWACYTNLLPPENLHIPSGDYVIQYLDAAGNEVDSSFTVSYPEKLFETKSADIKTVLPSSTDSIALYDKNDVLIYFGKRKNNWHTNANILRDFNAAVQLRHCLSANNNHVVCLLPAEYLIERPKDEAADEKTDAAGADND